MPFDRRIPLFALLSVVCFALTPLSDEDYDNIPPAVGTTYAVLALLFLLDWWTRRRSGGGR